VALFILTIVIYSETECSNQKADVTNSYGDPGDSHWDFELATDPENYHFHVTFTDVRETTVQRFYFFAAEALATVYINSVFLISDDDMASMPTSSR